MLSYSHSEQIYASEYFLINLLLKYPQLCLLCRTDSNSSVQYFQGKVDVQMFGWTRKGSALQSNITVRQAAVVSVHGFSRQQSLATQGTMTSMLQITLLCPRPNMAGELSDDARLTSVCLTSV